MKYVLATKLQKKGADYFLVLFSNHPFDQNNMSKLKRKITLVLIASAKLVQVFSGVLVAFVHFDICH